jgi:predicted transcriptional regulator
MATTTVRLDDAEERTLDELAAAHGGRSNALREGLRLLAATTRQRAALDDLLRDWDAEAGPVDDEAIAAAIDRYGL